MTAPVLGALVGLLLVACGQGVSPGPTVTPGAGEIGIAVAEEDVGSASPVQAEQGWFLRTVADLGDERGLCFDLVGWTPTNINFEVPLISHTCKHGWWNHDGRFDRAALAEGRLEMPFFGRCLEVGAAGGRFGLFARPCDGGELQRFTHLESGQIVPATDPDLCVSVSDEPNRDAGGDEFVLNDLVLDECDEEAADRQRWAFTEPL